MADIVNEQNTYVVKASFEDDDHNPVVPDSGSYRVDDITGGIATSVIANTNFVPVLTYYNIVIPSSSNVILDQSRDFEDRVLTVKFSYSGGRQGAGEYFYTLKNMRRIETLIGP